MFNHVRDLLFNLFIVFLPVVIYPYIIKKDREVWLHSDNNCRCFLFHARGYNDVSGRT